MEASFYLIQFIYSFTAYLQPYFKYQNFIQLTTSWLENNKIENDVHKLSNLIKSSDHIHFASI